MKSFRSLVIIGTALLSASWLLGSPRIVIGNGGGSSGVGSDFSVTPNDQGGGIFDFQNTTDALWTSLTLFAQFKPGTVLGPFDHTVANSQIASFLDTSFSYNQSSGLLTVLFSGVLPPEDAPVPGEVEDSAEGVAAGGHFFVDLFDLQGDPLDGTNGGWLNADGTKPTMEFAANLPEPRLIGLLLSAFGGMLLARRRFRRAK